VVNELFRRIRVRFLVRTVIGQTLLTSQLNSKLKIVKVFKFRCVCVWTLPFNEPMHTRIQFQHIPVVKLLNRISLCQKHYSHSNTWCLSTVWLISQLGLLPNDKCVVGYELDSDYERIRLLFLWYMLVV
jgi:hypothetical protein